MLSCTFAHSRKGKHTHLSVSGNHTVTSVAMGRCGVCAFPYDGGQPPNSIVVLVVAHIVAIIITLSDVDCMPRSYRGITETARPCAYYLSTDKYARIARRVR